MMASVYYISITQLCYTTFSVMRVHAPLRYKAMMAAKERLVPSIAHLSHVQNISILFHECSLAFARTCPMQIVNSFISLIGAVRYLPSCQTYSDKFCISRKVVLTGSTTKQSIWLSSLERMTYLSLRRCLVVAVQEIYTHVPDGWKTHGVLQARLRSLLLL